MRRFYLPFAALVGAACAWTLWAGAWGTTPDKLEGVPKSIRDNPGSYRSHYARYRRYYGGK